MKDNPRGTWIVVLNDGETWCQVSDAKLLRVTDESLERINDADEIEKSEILEVIPGSHVTRWADS